MVPVMAQQAGRLSELTVEVFSRACEEQKLCAASGHDLAISINVSPTELTSGLVQDLQLVLERSGTDPSKVELEVTEENPIEEHHYVVLSALAALGVHIVLDDFGAGYATEDELDRIREAGMHIHTVKLDKSVLDSGKAPELAQQLLDAGYEVVVEGVEHPNELHGLPEASIIQGFITGKAISATALHVRLERLQLESYAVPGYEPVDNPG